MINSIAPYDDRLLRPPNLSLMLARLKTAIENRRSRKWKLKLWSQFIRARDDYRCVYCALDGCSNHSGREIAAHHIFRRCVLSIAEFDTGNGISLCAKCHSLIHSKFNNRPRPGEPFNKRGGDNQDVIASLYHALQKDASQRGILCEDFYFINGEVFTTFKRMQGFDEDVELFGCRVSQAHHIWQIAPIPYYEALASQVAYDLLSGWGGNC